MRCRYTAEAVTPVCGHQAKRFAATMAEVQALLGDHQDNGRGRGLATRRVRGLPNCRELIAAERLERGNLRSRWPAVWKRASAKKLHRWFWPAHGRLAPDGARPLAGCGGRLKITNRW